MRALVLTGLMALGYAANAQQNDTPQIDARFADKTNTVSTSVGDEFAYVNFHGIRDKSKTLHIVIRDMNKNNIFGDAGDKVIIARLTAEELGQKLYFGEKSYELMMLTLPSMDYNNSKSYNTLVKDADKANRRTLRKGHQAFFENFSDAAYAEDETLIQNQVATDKALFLINAEFGLNLTRAPIGAGNSGPRLRGN